MKIYNLRLTSIITAMAVILLTAGFGAANAATQSRDQGSNRISSRIKHEGFGVLKAVNMKAGKVQLAHEAIPSLHWPPMTMWFTLKAPLPSDVKAGDNVLFEMEQTQPEEWAITRIEPKH